MLVWAAELKHLLLCEVFVVSGFFLATKKRSSHPGHQATSSGRRDGKERMGIILNRGRGVEIS